jgi:uncharacterized protein (TIGR03067 family)
MKTYSLALKMIFVISLTLFLSCTTENNPKIKIDAEKLQGLWQLVDGEVRGLEYSKKDMDKVRVLFKDNTFIYIPDEEIYTFKLDPTKTPKTIDLVLTHGPAKGKKFPSIYAFKEDKLWLCFPLARKYDAEIKRPAGFEANQSDRSIFMILERVYE